MIISEKQILQLLNCARSYSEKLKTEGIWGQTCAHNIDVLLIQIQDQQSDELKVIE
jgi:hypothetical protein